MIVCPNCNHQNPDGAQACENCYTPLPTTVECPHCGAGVQSDATFCGQCGQSLSAAPAAAESSNGEQPVAAPVAPDPLVTPDPIAEAPEAAAKVGTATQLQQPTAMLLHVQTDREIELSGTRPVIRIGKPNDRVPPDIDVSGFPNSEIVSRVHADIRAEVDAWYIEDTGSSNGTYINNLPLATGNRHRLRPGDRIALGKGDLVTFIFQSGGASS